MLRMSSVPAIWTGCVLSRSLRPVPRLTISPAEQEDEQQAKAQAAVGNGAKEEDQSADSSSQEKNEPNTVLNKHNRASHAVGYSTRLDNRVIDLRVRRALLPVESQVPDYDCSIAV